MLWSWDIGFIQAVIRSAGNPDALPIYEKDVLDVHRHPDSLRTALAPQNS